jgi:tRNA threonylcarbamoyladenosine biosynthesis protein TsaB
MLILGADTSGKNGSIALVRFEPTGGAPLLAEFARSGKSDTLEIAPLEGGTFSAQLVPQISALLKRHNLSKHDVDAFAVASGPGSFTGLRVGLAAIKALAEALQKPIAAVSRLEAIVRYANMSGEIIAALDAGRNEIYTGIYKIEENHCDLKSEDLLSVTEFILKAAGRSIVTPDVKVAEQLREAQHVRVIPLPQADVIAKIGYERIRTGQTVSPEALDASYIRRSDAEIMKSGSSPK